MCFFCHPPMQAGGPRPRLPEDRMKSGTNKRAVKVAGRIISATLEEGFWRV